MKRGKATWISFALILAVLAGLMTFSFVGGGGGSYASAGVIGDPSQSDVRAIVSNGTDKVTRIVYFKTGAHATGGANTPVPSSMFCDIAGKFHYAELQFTGTLSGAAPTLVIKWQNSLDKGVTWTDVGTWTTINATVTPANQKNTVADSQAVVLMNANTPVTTPAVMYGDCWRATYTLGAASSGNFTLIGADK